MKYFWLFFSFFLSSLSVYPCSDNDECEINYKMEISKNDSQEKQNHNTEHCTPFCTCSHCPASAIHQHFASLTFNINLPSCEHNPVNHYTSVYTEEISLAIWQPPKIS